MNKIIKVLKIILLTIAILIGVAILGGAVFIYKGIKSGDLKNYLTKTAAEAVIPKEKLTDEQQDMLESGDYEALAKDLQENVTEEQIDCAVEVLGPERANEIKNGAEPTPQEIIKLSKCL